MLFRLTLLQFVTAALAAPSVILLGDSTVTDGAGWGAGFCSDTNGLAKCQNLSSSGKTSVTFQGTTEWSTAQTACKTANTYATIQFGHNDQKVMTVDEFKTNLVSFTNKVIAAGCTPVLMTSLARRNFNSEYVPNDILGPYSAKTIEIAQEKGLLLLPLLADSLKYITKLGRTQSYRFNLDYDTTNVDRTHLNDLGHVYFGRIVADEVKSIVPALSSYIVANATLSGAIANGVIL
ncbi:SGNH hydrolase-type esterase domain-containing protein [Flagelloscypha sp. PMI_526]|nr:SGNH hydrolase-type esterase domain-containing protein [Flagelloscypha sp. PMI_526]